MKKITFGIVLALIAGTTAFEAAEADLRRDATVEAIEKVMPSVVNIRTETVVERHDQFQDLFRDFYNNRQQVESQYSLGSGVVIDEDGYVLTNLHVVQRARSVTVVLSNGKTYEALPLIIVNPRSDVAVLKLKMKPGEKLKGIKFAGDDDLLLGETVVALGNPFGLGGSVSRGILSSKRRVSPKATEELNVPNWLQTDAAINPGNSGGPLINLNGELIGINVAMLPEAQGIGFAIPVKDVKDALADIFTPETLSSLWFGARLRPGTSPPLVASVAPGSPAAQAGLKAGDQITQVNGRATRSFIEASGMLINTTSAPPSTIVVQRASERRTLQAHLLSFQEVLRQKLGADLQEINDELGGSIGVSEGTGLVVARVDKGGPAAEAELHSNIIIAAMDGSPVPNFSAALRVLAEKKKGDSLRLSVLDPQVRGNRLLGYRRATVNMRVR